MFFLIFIFYKHMKIRNQAQLCLAISDFEPLVSICLDITLNVQLFCVYESVL